MNQHKDAEYKLVSDELSVLRGRCGRVYREGSSEQSAPSTSAASMAPTPGPATPRSVQLSTLKLFEFPGEARVGAYNEWMNMLVISQSAKSPLYPSKLYI
jgi:hypothetical protein